MNLKKITVAGTESSDKKITIKVNTGETYKNGDPKTDKYTIWVTDRQGNPSIPYTQFQKLRPIAGDTLNVDVYEQPKSFVNQEGKQIDYTQRTINQIFASEAQNALQTGSPRSYVPNPSSTSETPVRVNMGDTESLAKMREWAKTVEARLTALELEKTRLAQQLFEMTTAYENHKTLHVDVQGEPAVELHMSSGGTEPEEKEIPIIEPTETKPF